MEEKKYRPILFSTEMVKAILAGQKTVTRRVVTEKVALIFIGAEFTPEYVVDNCFCKYGDVGDVMWVRESCCWVMLDHAHDLLEGARDRNQFAYKASMHPHWMEYAREKYGYKWTPSIHMPKIACRIFLKISSLAIERLWDITEEDAKKEGLTMVLAKNNGGELGYVIDNDFYRSGEEAFKILWQRINGIESWKSNPWVWRIEFERVDKPQDFC